MLRGPIHDLHASNLVTYASLALALGAMAAARKAADPAAAGALLAAAALADTLDGRLARRFARTERQAALGRQLDSLVDAVVFGVTPIVVLDAVATARGVTPAVFWWGAAFVYLLATVTRLAFYNVEEDSQRFVGVPTPAVAVIWSTCLFWTVPSSFAAALLLALGAAMVAPFRIHRPRGAALAAFACWAAGLVVGHLIRAF